MRAFCRERKLSEQSFYWWRRQLSVPTEQPIRFALVETATPATETYPLRPAQAPLELVFHSGARLQIPTDVVTLRLVLSVLREQEQADR